VHDGAQEPIEQHVAGTQVLDGWVDQCVLQNELAAQARLHGESRRLPRVVGLDSSRRDQRIRAFLEGGTDHELKFARLVATDCQTRKVVAFDVQRGRAELARERRHRFERCRQVNGSHAWKASKLPG
jgi:hypothetical protein